MLESAKAAGDAAAEFNDHVDGFGAAVARAVGVGVARERCPPAPRVLSELGDPGNRAVRQRGDELLSELAVPAGEWNMPRRLGRSCGRARSRGGRGRSERGLPADLLALAQAVGAARQDVSGPTMGHAHRVPTASRSRATERATGIEPASSVWKTEALPLSYARVTCGDAGNRG